MQPRSNLDPAREHVLDQLAEYYAGALSVAEDQVVEAHLLRCATCRAEFDDLGTIAVLVAWQLSDSAGDEPVEDQPTPTAGDAGPPPAAGAWP